MFWLSNLKLVDVLQPPSIHLFPAVPGGGAGEDKLTGTAIPSNNRTFSREALELYRKRAAEEPTRGGALAVEAGYETFPFR